MNITLSNVHDAIYLLRFDTQVEMSSTLLRFQEFYESPKFCGQPFTRLEFEKWYTKQTGAWTYLTDWTGFNFPSKVLEPFRRTGSMTPLSDQESHILEILDGIEEPYYIIAVVEDALNSTLRHEVAHGLWATNPDYKSEAQAQLEGCRLGPICAYLRPSYHPTVWMDECHAYLSANYEYLREKGVLKDNSLKETSQALNMMLDFYTDGKFKSTP